MCETFNEDIPVVNKHGIFPDRHVVWDLETSGLDPENDKILEIGLMVFEKGEKVEEIQWLLDNKIKIPAKITELTGITDEMIAEQGKPADLAIATLAVALTSNCVNVTHNGWRFDIPFLLAQVNKIEPRIPDFEKFKKTITENCVDTAAIFKAMKLGMKFKQEDETIGDFYNRVMEVRMFGLKYNVGAVCDHYQIDRTGVTQHRALADVYLTNEIFRKQCELRMK